MYLGKEIDLKVFSNLDWVNNEDDYWSIIDYFFKIAGESISWTSKHQKTVTILFIEAKYMALSEAVYESKWITEFIKDLGFQIQSPIIIYCDNKSAIIIVEIKGTKYCWQIKHIDIQHHYIKEKMEVNEIQLIYIPTG